MTSSNLPSSASLAGETIVTALDVEALEKIAREAEECAPGDWGIEDPFDHELSIVQADKPTHEWRFIAGCPLPDEDEHEAFTGGETARLAKHIATFDPPTVLALLSELKALRSQPAPTPSPAEWRGPFEHWLIQQMQVRELLKRAGYNTDEVHPATYNDFSWVTFVGSLFDAIAALPVAGGGETSSASLPAAVCPGRPDGQHSAGGHGS